MKRGKFYLTPFRHDHIAEVAENLAPENIRELAIMGFDDPYKAVASMYSDSECYIAREEGKLFTMVGGLWHHEQEPDPQMYAMFSSKIRENFHAMARGSRLLTDFFGKSHETMTMTILAEHQMAVDWACWLGFEPVEMFSMHGHDYIHFVRCRREEPRAYQNVSRPVMH